MRVNELFLIWESNVEACDDRAAARSFIYLSFDSVNHGFATTNSV